MSDLIPPLEGVTPEHAFMFMLLERVNHLEDSEDTFKKQLAWLESEIPNRIPYEWMCFRFTQPVDINTNQESIEDYMSRMELYYTTLRELCINSVFRHRNKLNPMFAHWSWCIKQNNVYELLLYVRFANPVCKHTFQYIHDEIVSPTRVQMMPVAGGSSDIKMILQERLGYNEYFPYTTPDFGMELWRKGGDEIDYPLEETWTHEDFTISPNYKNTPHEFFMLRDRLLVMVRMSRWVDLFRLQDFQDE
jgi:hypothetical protein